MQQVRKEIDAIDLQIRDLIAKRLDCSYRVAQAKHAANSTEIYREDREQQILETLGKDVPADRKPEYLSIVSKVMETSRMYQYGLLFDWIEDAFSQVEGHELANEPGQKAVVRLARPNKPNAMSVVLSMIGDYGFNMERMELLDANEELATFQLTILGDVTQESMRKLLFQLSKECYNFVLIANE